MNLHDKKKVWSLRYTPGNREVDELIERIAKDCGISRVAAGIIYNRGYETVDAVKGFLASSDRKSVV